jgi:predicted amidohydrolase
MDDVEFYDILPVGIVQTTVDANKAWALDAISPTMSAEQDEHAWQEISKAMRSFQDNESRPRLIVLPELSLPRTRLGDFEQLVSALNAIVIAGVDYRLDPIAHTAKNEGIVFVPKGFFQSKPSRYCTRVVFGKTHAAPAERAKLRQLAPSWTFEPDSTVYVFDCERYGCVGVSICYDFMDIERALLYRGQIQHLVVLAYNRDLNMFRALAESLSRTVFCNVIVCNTGHHGGSLAVSPHYEAAERVLYSHDGAKLFTAQVVNLPVQGLIRAQADVRERKVPGLRKTDFVFKDRPPGYEGGPHLSLRKKPLND